MLWICRSEIGGMEADSEFEPCRVAVYVGASGGLCRGDTERFTNGKIVFNQKK